MTNPDTHFPKDLITLITTDFPEPVSAPVGFLEIIGQQTKETVNSRLYAYFLDQSVNPAVSELFITALVDLLEQKTKQRCSFTSYTCQTEVVTRKGNRIDLLIEDEASDTAVVIENKLYHHLMNDLVDYLEHS